MAKCEIEYQVRDIDANGDAIDVEYFDTEAEAIAHAEKIALDVPAVVVERVKRRMVKNRSPFSPFSEVEARDYKFIKAIGDVEALQAGGWIE